MSDLALFSPATTPRCFALPVGCNFHAGLMRGLRDRLPTDRPEALARVEIFVNSHKSARQLRDILLAGPAGLLPRVRLIDDLAYEPLPKNPIPAAVSPLQRRLELSRIITALLDKDPLLAPRNAIFDLADSLANLMDEMHGEGVSPQALKALDVSDHAAHWQLSLTFLDILEPYFSALTEPDKDTRQRLVVEDLLADWQNAPPAHPVLVAGSTGSRGTTALLMQAVAGLPQGAVILPGFDFDLPDHAAGALDDPLTGSDHPQAGLVRLLKNLGLTIHEVGLWDKTPPACAARNRLVSLSLRPAPVTDQWLQEGPTLHDIPAATSDLGLIEAPTRRIEALAIALRLRKAAENGQKATLVSPDRQLTRQVTAALERWNIRPDDSAGRPLPLTPPGVFLQLTAGLMGEKLTSETLLILLKHPLTHSGPGRNIHLLRTRELELNVLRGGAPFADFAAIKAWAETRDDASRGWVCWLENLVADGQKTPSQPLENHVAAHRALAGQLARGPLTEAGCGALWLEEAGLEAARIFAELEQAATAGGSMPAQEYAGLLRSVLARGEVRDTLSRHPNITIWGARESRLLVDDLVILGGLNEGAWPKMPSPDPWLNRLMRAKIGLLLPERQIGLSAHDFQIAIGTKEVLLSRALRDAEAPTLASRWLIRLTNLLSGLGGDAAMALDDMRARGRKWVDLASAFDIPRLTLQPEARPAPRPPVAVRPSRLSVTQIKTLIRDPYAIYARHILKLSPLKPLRLAPDALLRGQALHLVLERFIKATVLDLPENAAQNLLSLAADVFETDVPWPATRRLWLARLARIADWFILTEQDRRLRATPLAFECWGKLEMPKLPFTLTAKADRIDRLPAGGVIIYDYKTGAIPTKGQIEQFDKQLPLEGAMVAAGAFSDIGPNPVAGLEYIGLGGGGKIRAVDISDDQINAALTGLQTLIRAYQNHETGYTARARMELRTNVSDYDHLSRLGEWDESDPAMAKDVS